MGKADLHIHTTFSDGSSSVQEVIKKAISLKLDTIAITDHNEIEGAIKAKEFVQKWGLPLDMIIGEEITTSDGHVVGLFLKERIRPLLTAEATVDEIHRQGGLAVAVHPFSMWLKLFKCGGVGRLVENLQFDAIESINGSPLEGFSNTYTKAFNRKIKLSAVAGSDAHTAEAIGQGYTVFPGNGSAMLYSAIKNKAVQAKSGKSATKALVDFIIKYLRGKMAIYGEKGGALDQVAAN